MSWRWVVFGFVAYAAIGLAIFIITEADPPPRPVMVPRVVGLDAERAEHILGGRGFRMSYPAEGIVWAQHPHEGTWAEPGITIEVYTVPEQP